jgi:hypothetical protein
MNIYFEFSTYLGEPIPYDPDVTPEVLAQRVKFLEKKKKYSLFFNDLLG